MTSASRSSLSSQLFWLCLLAGTLPLAVQLLLWLRGQAATESSKIADTMTIAGAAAVALLLVAWVLPDRLSTAFGEAVSRLRSTMARVAKSDFGARAEVAGPGLEMTGFAEELNALIENQQRSIFNLQLEVKQAVALRESSRQLIEECIYAREPLAKQHPGLAAAYAAAAIRQAGREAAAENETVDGLVEGVDTVGHRRENRQNLRWTLKDVRVDVPVPSKLVNMSVTGMAVESNRGLPVGGSWVFRVGTDAWTYDIPGKVCWCRLERTIRVDDDVRPVYRTGVEFDDKLSGKAFEFLSPAALDAGAA